MVLRSKDARLKRRENILKLLTALLLNFTTVCYAGQDFYAKLHTKEAGVQESTKGIDFRNGLTLHNAFGPAVEVTTRHVKIVEYWYNGRLHHPFGPAIIARDIKSGEIIFTKYYHQGILQE